MTQFSPMLAERLDEVLGIEVLAHYSPWTHRNFMDSLTAGHYAMLLEEGAALLGYAVVMPLPDEAELLNITIAPTHQRRGLGKVLLEHVCSAARESGAERMFLEVRDSNLPARTLYDHSGFTEVGRRRDYYALDGGKREDAILMARVL